jgi:hypothetical protein
MIHLPTDTKQPMIFYKIFTTPNGFYKIFVKVQSNTARPTSTNTKKTATFAYLQKIFFRGDEKDFFNPN